MSVPTDTPQNLAQIGLRSPIPWATVLAVLSAALGWTACSPRGLHKGVTQPCNGLQLAIVDTRVAPPANVSAAVRATGCSGAALGQMLEAANFDLAEDGAVLSTFEASRSIEALARQQTEYTALLLDLSGSISRAGFKSAMVEGARQLIRALPDHQIAIFGFDGRPDLILYAAFTRDSEKLNSALDRLGADPVVDDSTNLNGAIVEGLAALDQVIARAPHPMDQVSHGSLVVFTDGTDRADRVSSEAALLHVAESEYATYAIGVGAELDTDKLTRIGRTATSIAQGAGDILVAFEAVARAVEAYARRDYLVSYCSPARSGSHVLTIRAKQGEATASADMPFSAEGFGAGCSPDASDLR